MTRLKLLKVVLIALMVLVSRPVKAIDLIAGSLGYGQGLSSREATDREGPLGYSFAMESVLSSSWSLGAEHQRTLDLKTSGSNVSSTGLTVKYYAWGSTPTKIPTLEEMRTGAYYQSGYHVFVGSSAGFSQSTIPLTAEGLSSNATGVFIGLQSGFDLALFRQAGLRVQANLQSTVFGSGTIQMTTVLFGFYWML